VVLDFLRDPDGTVHFEKHEVSQAEVTEFFTEIRFIQRRRPDGSVVANGILGSGRILETVFRRLSSDHIFVITAYDVLDGDQRDYIIRRLE
jgi:uncharacterized DUF497 family protein